MSASGTSLISEAKRRILAEMLPVVNQGSADPEAGARKQPGIVLVLDSHTLKIVSAACKRHELSDAGVLFIEQLDKPRQPFTDMDAIYFVSSASASFDQILTDHKKPLYRYTHLFVSAGRVADSVLSSLTSSKEFVSRCRNLVELNLDFVSFEPHVFHSDMPLAVKSIIRNEDAIIAGHVDCLSSLCASLKEKPVLRYMGTSSVSQRVALGLRRELDDLNRQLSADNHLKANGTTVLVLDRSVETAGLFLHDFYYQALALDLLDGVDDHGGVKWALGMASADDSGAEQATSVTPYFGYKTTTGKGTEEIRKVVLGDHDSLWVENRHEHFRVASDAIARQLTELVKTNEQARASTDPLGMLRGLPEYQDRLAKLSVHIELSKSLMSVFEKLGLMEVAKLEQELATGVDDDGKEIVCPKLFTVLSNLFKDSRVGAEERLRLTMLYLSQVEGVSEQTAIDLVEKIAQLEPDFQEAVSRFLKLNIHSRTRIQPDGVMHVSPSVQANRHTIRPDLAEKTKLKKNKLLAKNSKFVNCRFRSVLADIVEQVLANQLDQGAFPTIGGTGSSNYSLGSAEPATGAAKWGQTATAKSKQRVVVFVVGGVTLGEAREMAELESKFDADIFLGGSTVLTPKRFIEILMRP